MSDLAVTYKWWEDRMEDFGDGLEHVYSAEMRKKAKLARFHGLTYIVDIESDENECVYSANNGNSYKLGEVGLDAVRDHGVLEFHRGGGE